MNSRPLPNGSPAEGKTESQRDAGTGSRRHRAESSPLAMHYCPNCSQRLEERGCKLRCRRCGYFMDCSDYY